MADEIRQDLGFDAAKALETLKALDKSMGSFAGRLGQSVKAMDAFNKKGGGTVALLKKLSREGDRAAKTLAKVATLSGQAGGGKGASVGSASGVDQYIKQLESMYKVSEKATTAQKRSYQSAITSTAEYAAKNKVSIGQVIAQANNLDKNFTGTANSMANKLSQIDRASKNHLGAAGQSVRRLTIDFQTMVRIVSTQVIVRALSSLRNAFSDAVSDAIDFQTKIAEIGTISPTKDLENLAKRVRDISDEFNTPLDVTAKGYYQTISNQIGSSVEEFDSFMSAAAKFSKTAVTDIDAAVNLGSGALNAFDKSASEAEDTFAKFFATIKQGRVVGSELAQGMGSVMPLADKLNVELEEVNAALATITIQGVAADKAFTQLRGIFNAFIKPSKEMKEALRNKLGFDTGEDILQAYDLQEALQKVVETTDGSSESIGELIPRLRGMTGGMALLSDEAGHFNKTLEEQERALKEIYGEGYDLVINSNAYKVTKEINELSNYMTTEFGESILKVAANMSLFVGGADNVKSVMNGLAYSIPLVTIGLTAFGTSLLVSSWKAKVATKSFRELLTLKGLKTPSGILALTAAAAGAFSLGSVIGEKITESWTAEQKAFKKLMEEENKARKEKISEEIKAEEKKAKELESLMAQEGARLNQTLFALSTQSVSNSKIVLEDIKSLTKGVLSEIQKAATASRNELESLGESLKSADQRIAELEQKKTQKAFERSLKGQSDRHQVYSLIGQSESTAIRAANKMRKARTEEEREIADQLFRQAEAFATQASTQADASDNAGLIAKAGANYESIINKNIAAEKVFKDNLKQALPLLLKRNQIEEKRYRDAEAKQKQLLQSAELYDPKTGDPLSENKRKENIALARQQLKEFAALAPGVADGVTTQIANRLNSLRIKRIAVDLDNLESMFDPIQAKLDSDPFVARLEVIVGKEITGQGAYKDAMEGVKEEQKLLREIIEQYKGANSDLAWAREVFQKTLAEAEKSNVGELGSFRYVENRNAVMPEQDIKMLEKMQEALQKVKLSADDGKVSLKELKQVARELAKLEQDQSWAGSKSYGNFKADLSGAILEAGRLINAREKLKAIQESSPEGRSLDQMQQRLQQLQQLQQILEKPKQDAAATDTSLNSAKAAMDGAVSPSTILRSDWQSIASSAQAAALAAGSMGGPSIPIGDPKMQYNASGGQARGTDTIPAMLSPGEFVVNARSSRQFYSELTAINAGMKPVYRESGGSVTNIGDVSINVTETKSPKQTARDVMSAFRREMRRGSARL